MIRRIDWWNLMLLMVLFMLLVRPSPVAAHLDLERAEPEDGNILDAPPDKVRLWFGGELDTFESSVAVFDEQEHQVDLGDAEVSLADRALLQVSLPDDLPPGVYTVRWTAVDDEDAHPIDGQLTFTIARAPETRGVNLAATGLAVVVGVSVVIVAWFWRGRRQMK